MHGRKRGDHAYSEDLLVGAFLLTFALIKLGYPMIPNFQAITSCLIFVNH